jgi:phosphinothricin acetyltransferase
MTYQFEYATEADLPELTEIYNHYVLNTAITFDTIPFKVEERTLWFSQFQPKTIHQCLVHRSAGRVTGYACSTRLRPKPAYDSSAETTIYLAPAAIGKGLGSALYQQLISNVEQLGIHRCYGIIALPNATSIRLHEKLGFKQVAVLNEVGFKFGRYHDTAWFEKPLG